MKRRLILLRHGQTDYNATRRMQGQLDTELSPLGIEQARAAGESLKGCGVSKIVSSDLIRARHTAEIVASALNLDVTQDSRLRETHLGQWQGKTHHEVDTEGEGIRAYWRNNAGWAPPAGESRLDVATRTRLVVDELVATYDTWGDSAVLLVAHGGTISALTSSLLELHEHQYPMFRGLKNAHTARLTAQPVYREQAACTQSADKKAGSGQPLNIQWYLDAWNQGMSG